LIRSIVLQPGDGSGITGVLPEVLEMAADIQIQASDDALSLQVVEDVVAHKDEFATGGVVLEYEKSYGFLGGVGEGIIVGVLPKIGADYGKKLLDLLVETIRNRMHFAAPVIVQRQSHQFVLPRDYQKAVDFFKNEEAD
jgi:hypothetical protein